MATSRDSPNPLRPYYIPPSISLPRDSVPSNSTTSTSTTRANFSTPTSLRNSSKASFGSAARDYLSDLDYGEYLGSGVGSSSGGRGVDVSPGVADMAKRLMDQAIWNYTCVLLAQPFEVARLVLQVHDAGASLEQKAALASAAGGIVPGSVSRPSSFAGSGKFEDYPSSEDDSEGEAPSYFTSTAPQTQAFESSPRSPDRIRRAPSRSATSTPTPGSSNKTHKLELRKPDVLLDVISQLWQKESAWGLWKGTNATFVYNFLLKSIESWTRSLLSALLNVPDPGFIPGSGIGGIDIVDSQNPLGSLVVAVTATAIAGVFLAPLDLIRTRLILTTTTSPPRNILPSLRSLPTLSIASELLPVTLIHSIIPTLFSATAPLFLRSSFGVDPILTPATYSVATFLTSTAELFLRLPLETVLRRGQVAVLQDHEREKERDAYTTLRNPSRRGLKESPDGLNLVVNAGPFKGTFGTMWFIIREEGVTFVGPVGAAAKARRITPRVKRGQGLYGLWRGWRVGFWGLVGVWGAAALGNNAGGEF